LHGYDFCPDIRHRSIILHGSKTNNINITTRRRPTGTRCCTTPSHHINQIIPDGDPGQVPGIEHGSFSHKSRAMTKIGIGRGICTISVFKAPHDINSTVDRRGHAKFTSPVGLGTNGPSSTTTRRKVLDQGSNIKGSSVKASKNIERTLQSRRRTICASKDYVG
jgi:hypothetical protein